MSQMMLYNLRSDINSLQMIGRRLREENEISMGWGGALENLSLENPDYVQRTREVYHLNSGRLPTNLSRIRSFQDGDLIVMPHVPTHGTCSVHVVDGSYPACYRYVEGDETHLNHRIKVRESFGLSGNIHLGSIRVLPWYAKLQWLRYPVLPIPQFEDAFRGLVNELRANPQLVYEPSNMQDLVDQLSRKVLAALREELLKLPPSAGNMSFERVCEYLLSAHGYTIVARNRYDGAGGDVDLHCRRTRESSSPFEPGESELFVQVKKYDGVAGELAIEQIEKRIGATNILGCVMTTADSFSRPAREKAIGQGIHLLSGDDICRLLVKTMFSNALTVESVNHAIVLPE